MELLLAHTGVSELRSRGRAPHAPAPMVGTFLSVSGCIRRAVLAAAGVLRHAPYAGPAVACGDDCEPCGGSAIPNSPGDAPAEDPLNSLDAQAVPTDKAPLKVKCRDPRARRLVGEHGSRHHGGRRPGDIPRAQEGAGGNGQTLVQYRLTCFRTLVGTGFTLLSTEALILPVVVIERYSAQALFCVGCTSPQDADVAWVGDTGAVLCMCFEILEDAELYRIDGRACSCSHAQAPEKVIHLLTPPARCDKTCPKCCARVRRGPVSEAVAVWDALIFTVVTAVNGSTDLCLAPGCRVAPHQCGHVQAARGEVERAKPLVEQDAAAGCADVALAAALHHVDGVDGGYAADNDNYFLAQQLGLNGGEHLPDDNADPDTGASGGAACALHGAPGGFIPPTAKNIREGWTLTEPVTRNMEPCKNKVAMSSRWAFTAELIVRASTLEAADVTFYNELVERGEAFDVDKTLREPVYPDCYVLAPASENQTFRDTAVLTTSSRPAVPISITVGNRECEACRKMVVIDGERSSLFVLLYVDAEKRLAVFTREVCDNFLEFFRQLQVFF